MRRITQTEISKIRDYFKKTFFINISNELNKYDIFIFDSKIFFLTKSNNTFKSLILMSSHFSTYMLSLGLYFGSFMQKGEIKLSLEGFCIFAKLIKKSYIVLNEAGEQMFLYGKNILYEGLSHFKSPIRKNKLLYVFNKNHECIGIAKSVVSDTFLFKNKDLHVLVARNLYDKGLYIRASGHLFEF